jgi:hypothetical protein
MLDLPITVVESPPGLPFSPGAYLRKRREAAGVTIAIAAAAYAGSAEARTAAELTLQDFEADRKMLTGQSAEKLRQAFAFDPHIYFCLVDGVPAGKICTGCACTWNDACTVGGRGCSWAMATWAETGEVDICSACVDRMSAAITGVTAELEELVPTDAGPWLIDPADADSLVAALEYAVDHVELDPNAFVDPGHGTALCRVELDDGTPIVGVVLKAEPAADGRTRYAAVITRGFAEQPGALPPDDRDPLSDRPDL